MSASLAVRLGSPRCAFVTGGPREYWPGISCIAARLAALGTAHPVLAMVLTLALTLMPVLTPTLTITRCSRWCLRRTRRMPVRPSSTRQS